MTSILVMPNVVKIKKYNYQNNENTKMIITLFLCLISKSRERIIFSCDGRLQGTVLFPIQNQKDTEKPLYKPVGTDQFLETSAITASKLKSI